MHNCTCFFENYIQKTKKQHNDNNKTRFFIVPVLKIYSDFFVSTSAHTKLFYSTSAKSTPMITQ